MYLSAVFSNFSKLSVSNFNPSVKKYSAINISVGVRILHELSIRTYPNNVESIATLYQNLYAKQVSDYGARVKCIYDNKLWEK